MHIEKELKSAATLPIYTNTALILLQFSIGMMMKSVGVISFALDTVIDLFIAFICLVGIIHAAKPASSKHPYGYGKAENIANLFVAIAIFGTAALLVYEASVNLMKNHQIGHIWMGVAVLIFTAVVNFIVYRYLLEKAENLESTTLHAQAVNLKIDAVTSIAIAAGLVIIYFSAFTFIDPIIAILIVGALIKTGYDILKSSLSELMDRRLPDTDEKDIMQIIRDHSERFVGFQKLKSRRSGRHRHIEVHLVMCKSQSLLSAHEISRTLEEGIRRKFPDSTVVIKTEPCTVLHADCKGKCSAAHTKGYMAGYIVRDQEPKQG